MKIFYLVYVMLDSDIYLIDNIFYINLKFILLIINNNEIFDEIDK